MEEGIKALEEFGLSKNKAAIYLTLLRSGSSTAEKLARVSGIHRRNVYDTLEDLMKIGLASSVVNDGKKFFKATSPDYLLEILNDKEEEIKRKRVNITSTISNLSKIQKLSKEENFVTIYKGVGGVKAILNDVLRTRKENLVIGAHKPPESAKDYMRMFHQKRVSLGIAEKLIFNQNDIERAKSLSKLPLTQIKFMPKKTDNGVAVNIYDDKVAILMWADALGVLIKRREFADSFRDYFNMMWKSRSTK